MNATLYRDPWDQWIQSQDPALSETAASIDRAKRAQQHDRALVLMALWDAEDDASFDRWFVAFYQDDPAIADALAEAVMLQALARELS